ncbi:MAG: hypothetical protein WC046_10235, partial [Candidatus Bathyarchaeia archaeon]
MHEETHDNKIAETKFQDQVHTLPPLTHLPHKKPTGTLQESTYLLHTNFQINHYADLHLQDTNLC